MIKILIVDDSAFMRNTLSSIFSKKSDIEIVGTARNGEEGLELIKKLNPDVVTLDIEMPRMDGLTALKHIMAEMPRPVIMISSLTTEGAEATLKAMELGAADFIAKQTVPDESYAENIRQTVLSVAKSGEMMRRLRALRATSAPKAPATLPLSGSGAAAPASTFKPAGVGARPSTFTPSSSSSVPPPSSFSSSTAASTAASTAFGARQTTTAAAAPISRIARPLRDVVGIGVSTGGPPVVQKILEALPENFPAGILIAQHMPAAFTGPFAKRLDSVSKLTVKEAETGDRLRPGMVFVSPGGKHISIKPSMEIVVSADPVEALYKPSANVLMESLGRSFGKRALGVMLTGMGSDGLEGSKVLKDCGGRMIAQSEQTCVVYGMPKAVVDANLADKVVDLDDIAQAMIDGLYCK